MGARWLRNPSLALVVLISLAIVNVAVDLLYAAVDPRVRLG